MPGVTYPCPPLVRVSGVTGPGPPAVSIVAVATAPVPVPVVSEMLTGGASCIGFPDVSSTIFPSESVADAVASVKRAGSGCATGFATVPSKMVTLGADVIRPAVVYDDARDGDVSFSLVRLQSGRGLHSGVTRRLRAPASGTRTAGTVGNV